MKKKRVVTKAWALPLPESENRINEFRLDLNMQQKELAKLCGVTVQHLTKITAGYIGPIHTSMGVFNPWATKMGKALKRDISDIWPREICTIKRNELTDDQKLNFSVSDYSQNTSPHDMMEKKERALILSKIAYNNLTDREWMILCDRIYEDHTLRDISEKFLISRERARQIEKKAFRKMKEALKIKQHHI